MPLFVFHLCHEDGSSPAFEAFELSSDHHVLDRAMAMLDQHGSCDHVSVWKGEEFVMRLDRNRRLLSLQPPSRPPTPANDAP